MDSFKNIRKAFQAIEIDPSVEYPPEVLDRCEEMIDDMIKTINKEIKWVDKQMRENGEFDPEHTTDNNNYPE